MQALIMKTRNPLDLVTIIAGKGPEHQQFKIHKEVCCEHSPVLKSAFTSVFIEGRTQTYKLDDASPEAVRLLCGWLYAQQLDIESAAKLWTAETFPKKFNELKSLVELWILAGKLLLPRLQNLAINTIKEYTHAMKAAKGVLVLGAWNPLGYYHGLVAVAEQLYNNTAEGSPLRLLCIEDLSRLIVVEPGFFAKTRKNLPNELTCDILAFITTSGPMETVASQIFISPESSLEVPEN